MRIGNRVTLTGQPSVYHGEWDGTIVDIIDNSPLFRVYWRYPPGKVSDYRANELNKVKPLRHAKRRQQ